MACLFLDSFDYYATAEILQKYTGPGQVNSSYGNITVGAYGRNGTQGLRNYFGYYGVSNQYISIAPAVAASGATAIAGIGFNPNGWPTNEDTSLLSFYDGSTIQCCLRVNRGGTVSVVRGLSNGTVLGTSSVTIPSGLYSYIELKVVHSTTVGTFEVRLNGTPILSGTGANTANAATAVWTNCRICNNRQEGSAGEFAWHFDDAYLCDGSGGVNDNFLGPIMVVGRRPDAAGASSDFTPLAGANWQNLDETLNDGDTSYVTGSVAGDHDTYGFAALGVVGIVKALQVNTVVRSTGAGSETIAPMVRIGSDYQGNTVGISTSYLNKYQVYDKSPATAVAWTVSEIDGAEFGAKLVS